MPAEKIIVPEIAKLLDLGAAQASTRHPVPDPNNGKPFIVVPSDYAVKDLEALLPTPSRKRGKVTVITSESFITYVNKHKNGDATTIYANLDFDKTKVSIVAVLDGHAAARPGWENHTCRYEPVFSVDWKRWIEADGNVMDQANFAMFIENNIENIGQPPDEKGFPSGQDMLKMALDFEANSDKRLTSKVSLQSGGHRLEFVDDANAATKAAMQTFDRFAIILPIFEGSKIAYIIKARLRYRENNGRLSFWYELIRPDRAFKAAVQETAADIATQTECSMLFGYLGS